MKQKKDKWNRPMHHFAFWFLRVIVRPFLFLIYGYRTKKYKLKKKQGYFIISNHQSLLDPLFVALSFKRPIYYVATDNLFTHKFKTFIIKFLVRPIPKRKGNIDVGCLKSCIKIAKQNQTIGIFVEGNRAYGDFQFYIDPVITKLIRKMNLPVILYNLKGGFGVDPRWGNQIRKGKFTGEVAKELTTDIINSLSDEELYNIICDTLRVYDSESGKLYKSKKRAEYLERQFFICPKCKKMETIYSNGNYVYCSNCDLKIEYTENLLLKSADDNVNFTKLVDWYKFQLDFIKTYKVPEGIIFQDSNVEIYISNTNEPRKLIQKGTLTLTNKYLQCGNYRLFIEDIISLSPTGGFKMLVATTDNNYIIKGKARFNPVKYTLLMNVLDGPINKKGGDCYYSLELFNNKISKIN